jgi:hypothetical protein
MVYEHNTYISPEGRDITNKIFDNLFNHDASSMRVATVPEIVDHFRGSGGERLHQTTQLIKNFIQGYEHLPFIQSYNSGYHICPACFRRDYLWLWEYVDFGLRNENEDWTSSVNLVRRTYDLGAGLSDIGYRFICRVRCNDATTCNKCHMSVTGHFSSCRACSSNDVSKVGCGQESYTTHLVNEVQMSEWINVDRFNSNTQKYVTTTDWGGQMRQNQGVRPFMYRVMNPGPAPNGAIIATPEQAFQYIPHLEIGYESYDGEHRRPYGYKCPNSDCEFERYAPLHTEQYKVPDEQPGEYDQVSMKISGSKTTSSGPAPTVNQNGEEAQGGLVDNMGVCPNPDCLGIKLVPRDSIKDTLPSICFDGTKPLGYRTWASAKRYHAGSHSAITTRDVDDGLRFMSEYCNRQINRWRNSRPASYPFSPLIRAFTRTAMEICKRCFPVRGVEGQYFWSPHEGMTMNCQYCGGWKPEDRERDPEWRLNPPMQLRILNSQPLEARDISSGISVGNPYDNSGTVWKIRLECPQNEQYGVLQETLQFWSLCPLPTQPAGPPIPGMGIQLCPNDVEAEISGEVRAKKLAEAGKDIEIVDEGHYLTTKLVNLKGKAPDGTKMEKYWKNLQDQMEVPKKIIVGSQVQVIDPDPSKKFQTITTGDLLKYRPTDEITSLYGREWEAEVRTENIMLPPDEDSLLGVTAPGFSFVVCEGRSREAFRNRLTNKWIDASPECRSYHDRSNPGTPFKTPITYPRWTQTPESDIRPPLKGETQGRIISADGTYYWNHTDHFAQDQLIVNDYLAQFLGGSGGIPTLMTKYHRFEESCDPLIDVMAGQYIQVYECHTCEKMWNIGRELQRDGEYAPGKASLTYYQTVRNYVGTDGITLDENVFPQECLEGVMEKEGDNIANFGVEDSVMTGMGRGGSQPPDKVVTAKEMLEQPKLRVDVDE